MDRRPGHRARGAAGQRHRRDGGAPLRGGASATRPGAGALRPARLRRWWARGSAGGARAGESGVAAATGADPDLAGAGTEYTADDRDRPATTRATRPRRLSRLGGGLRGALAQPGWQPRGAGGNGEDGDGARHSAPWRAGRPG